MSQSQRRLRAPLTKKLTQNIRGYKEDIIDNKDNKMHVFFKRKVNVRYPLIGRVTGSRKQKNLFSYTRGR
jgi:hypothetical protein